MANKAKIGLEYFPFEVSFFSDIKVRKLIKYQGCKAISVYALLLCKIYENGYYMRWDNELPFMISETTGYEEGYVSEVIKCCASVGLINDFLFREKKILTSKGIQERFNSICKSAKRKTEVIEFNLISSESIGNNSEELTINTEEMVENSEEKTQSKVKESKVKYSKEKESKDSFVFENSNSDLSLNENLKKEKEKSSEKKEKVLTMPWDTQSFIDLWTLYKKFRKQEHGFSFKGEISEQAALNELSKLSKGQESIAKELINQTFTQNWKGIFPLKNNGTNIKPNTLANTVHNVHNTSYGKL